MATPIEGRWSPDQAHAWAERSGWLVGCNFTPSTAGNQLELWQRETFDPETIDRELGWAAGLGMNVIRLYLHDLMFEAEG
ncbi:MAG TPA: 1,4-beta-xylanase, partial [Acidimicrobiaceae bacterium]|nr:1,4-beta-xylanase [Acidimicrobiaceae bacterium]